MWDRGSRKTTRYGHMVFFAHKLAGDKWEPALWEIPLYRLPKRLEAH